MREITVDIFAGGGGASEGIEQAPQNQQTFFETIKKKNYKALLSAGAGKD